MEGILSAANLLQMDIVKDLACQLLQAQLSPTNCLQIWHIADLYSCYELQNKAESYTQEHFMEVVNGPDFLALSKERIEKIISRYRNFTNAIVMILPPQLPDNAI